ncbi:MAG: ferrous iron transport protein B [Planctomycetota bacterium]
MVSDILGTIAVIGNPNVGKTTLFNALTGLNQRIGNYSGVTVEKKMGYFSCQNQSIALIDLPGMYSLSAHSLDERIALDNLVGQLGAEHDKIQGVLVIVDASNLQRNLYLFSQITALKKPMLLALNMLDMAKKDGVTIHSDVLARQLKVPVVSVQANSGLGVEELKRKLVELLQGKITAPQYSESEVFQPPYTEALQLLQNALPPELLNQLHPFQLERILVDQNGYYETQLTTQLGEAFQKKLQAIRQQAENEKPLSALEAEARYRWIEKKLVGILEFPQERKKVFSEYLDAILIHRFFGLFFFIGLMLLLFQSIYTWASPCMDFIDQSFGSLGEFLGNYLPEGALRSLVVDGICAGIGGVLIFLPQILILFLFLAILEDCGYMARAAFLMDRIMFQFGLSGKSFIPLLSSFACAIPGIMASRVIANRQDRFITILVAPLISCSARLPVYTILISAFIPPLTIFGFFNLQGLVLFAAYMLGAIVAVFMALVFKKTIFKGPATPFVMELPNYQWPNLRTIFFRMYEAGLEFLYRAGTIIFAITLIIWALAYYPRNEAIEQKYQKLQQAEESHYLKALEGLASESNLSEKVLKIEEVEQQNKEHSAALENEKLSQHLENSFLARLGKTVQPFFAPLGWDWKISTAAIASFPAREVIVATMGTIYSLGSEEDESSESLRDALKNSKNPDGSLVFNIPVALSILVFFALCAQCGATLAIIKRETMSWKWPLFTFVYMTTLAYFGGLLTYQIGRMWL